MMCFKNISKYFFITSKYQKILKNINLIFFKIKNNFKKNYNTKKKQ